MTRPIGATFHHQRPDPRRVPLHEGERRRMTTYLLGGLTLQQVAALTGVSVFTVQSVRRSLRSAARP
jgi:hypothetical protein